LLSDKGSDVIRRFGLLNANMAPELRSYGVPHPVEYLISPDGIVVQKYFVPNYQHRVTASAVALRQFGESSPDAPVVAIESGAVRVQIGLPSRHAFAGQEVSFFARFALEPDWHMDATSIEFDSSVIAEQHVTWPETDTPYRGLFEVRGNLLLKFPLPEGELILPGRLRFQQCSETVCEPPQTIAFELPLTLGPFLISERDRKLLEKKSS
jgi:hypothetical protein